MMVAFSPDKAGSLGTMGEEGWLCWSERLRRLEEEPEVLVRGFESRCAGASQAGQILPGMLALIIWRKER